MRLLADGLAARIVRLLGAVTLAASLGACGIVGGGGDFEDRLPAAPTQVNGPQADYPIVLGAPYAIAGVSYAPEDVLNYDEVGYLAADQAGGSGVSASHHTLPLPSYVEVTSLSTGRTILARVERRGPMSGNELVALSPGALAQLGDQPGAPVRVRRVNPPEEQRALLRAGQPAPQRMDTPMPLVEVLKRKLPGQGSAPLRSAQAAPASGAQAQPAQIASAGSVRPVAIPPSAAASRGAAPALPPLEPRGSATPAQAARAPAVAAAPVASGRFIVQAAAFSTSDRAQRAATVLGGDITRAGQYFRVHTGPFATRGEAEASLAKVRAAGYTDARISTSG